MTRASDDKLKASVCRLSKLLLEGNDISSTVNVFLMMEKEDIDALIACIWTFGGQWGNTLREMVVTAVQSKVTSNSSNAVIMEGTFGEGFAEKSTCEQADLFSDLLSPKVKARTPENDPLKALVDVATPITPALPCDIGTRLLGVDSAPSSATSTFSSDSTTFKSPLVPKVLNVGAKTQSKKVDAPLEAKTPSQGETSYIPPQAAPNNDAKTPAAKERPTSTAMYTPYEKALRSLKKGKTPKLEFSPPFQHPGTDGAPKFKVRPSSMSPIITDTLGEEDVASLPKILNGLKNSSAPEEQYVMLQSLLRHAKTNSDDVHWESQFSGILDCLLGKKSGGRDSCVISFHPFHIQSHLSVIHYPL